MRRDIYAARLQIAQERVQQAGAGMGMDLSMPPQRDPEMRHLQFLERLADEMDLLSGAAPDAEVDDRERIERVVGDANAQSLVDAGYDSVAAIQDASDDDLNAVAGIGPATIARLREAFGEAE